METPNAISTVTPQARCHQKDERQTEGAETPELPFVPQFPSTDNSYPLRRRGGCEVQYHCIRGAAMGCHGNSRRINYRMHILLCNKPNIRARPRSLLLRTAQPSPNCN